MYTPKKKVAHTDVKGRLAITASTSETRGVVSRWFRSSGWHVVDCGVETLEVLAAVAVRGLIAEIEDRGEAIFDLIGSARTLQPELRVLVVATTIDARMLLQAQRLDVALAVKPELGASFQWFAEECSRAQSNGEALEDVADAWELSGAERRLLRLGLISTRHPYLADALGISRNTLKSQIRSVLAKTGAKSFDEVVRPLRNRLAIRTTRVSGA